MPLHYKLKWRRWHSYQANYLNLQMKLLRPITRAAWNNPPLTFMQTPLTLFSYPLIWLVLPPPQNIVKNYEKNLEHPPISIHSLRSLYHNFFSIEPCSLGLQHFHISSNSVKLLATHEHWIKMKFEEINSLMIKVKIFKS